MKSRILTAVAVAVLVALTHECLLNATGGPKLTVRVSPLVRLTRGDARGVVTVPRHADNRMLRVVLESEDLLHPQRIAPSRRRRCSAEPSLLLGPAARSYRVTVQIYSATGLRDFTSIGDIHALLQKR
jgi:hypothetical protein